MIDKINNKIAALDEVIEGYKKGIKEAEKKKAMWEELGAEVLAEMANNSVSNPCEADEVSDCVEEIAYGAIN